MLDNDTYAPFSELNLAINEENCVNISENLGLQMANKVHIDGPLNAYKVIDSIPNEEVLQLAKDIVSRSKCSGFLPNIINILWNRTIPRHIFNCKF